MKTRECLSRGRSFVILSHVAYGSIKDEKVPLESFRRVTQRVSFQQLLSKFHHCNNIFTL